MRPLHPSSTPPAGHPVQRSLRPSSAPPAPPPEARPAPRPEDVAIGSQVTERMATVTLDESVFSRETDRLPAVEGQAAPPPEPVTPTRKLPQVDIEQKPPEPLDDEKQRLLDSMLQAFLDSDLED